MNIIGINLILIGVGILLICVIKFKPEVYRSFYPMSFKDAKWTLFIFKNLKKIEKIDNRYCRLRVRNKDYIISFSYSWLYHIYEGETVEEIRHKYDLGGQSNRADYLTIWQKIIGHKIEHFYLKEINS